MASNHTTSEWTMKELQTAIQNEIRIFEAGHQSSITSQSQFPSTSSFHTSAARKPHNRREPNSKLSCMCCKANHTALTCETHKDVQSRLQIIKQQRLCYNCLAHHRVSQCNSKNHCWRCGNKYHTSICCDTLDKTASSTTYTTENTPHNWMHYQQIVTLLPPVLDPSSARHSICLLKKQLLLL